MPFNLYTVDTAPFDQLRRAPADPASDLQRLAASLIARRDEVVARMVAGTSENGQLLDDHAERRFERVGTVSTIAVAMRMAHADGEPPDEDQESWLIFGELAAQRALPLNEVIRRCLSWRDSAEAVAHDIAADLGTSDHVASIATGMIQRSLSKTLIQMGEAFESERRRTDEERTRREEELAFKATHDPLTELPNRALLLDRLQQMLVRSRHSGTSVAALFIDLDDFKTINDTLGHAAGDQLLRQVAARFAAVTRDVDALGRLAGDEFVLLAGEMSPLEGPEPVAERLLDALRVPFELGEAQTLVSITASVGIEMSDQLSPGELLRDADIAMYRAKWAGKNRYFMFKREPRSPVVPAESSLRRGVDRLRLRRAGRVSGSSARRRRD